jgi:hypothetical protein
MEISMAKTIGSCVFTGPLLVLLLASAPSAGQQGAVRDGRYRHPRTGVELAVPPDWLVLNTSPSSDGGDQMYLQYSGSPGTYVAVWMKPEINTPAEADAWLQLAPKMKVNQRHEGGIPQFVFRPESIQRKYVGEQPAVSAIADFVPAHASAGPRRPARPASQKLVEYFTWVFTEHTRVQFDVRGSETAAALVASRLEEIVQAARIP